MGLLSSTVSITRYRVQGDLQKPVLETVANGLKKYTIAEIDDDAVEKSVGWTSFEKPYAPDFSGSSFVIGPYLIFSLRIDKKNISPKLVKKQYAIEANRRLTRTGRQFISGSEKKIIQEQVLNLLSLKIPATPNVYDLVWNLENRSLWYYTNLKTANEELESLFSTSFALSLIRMFPYTSAALTADLSDSQKDILERLAPVDFRT
ncbi:MAG: exonuclease [Deltaproteobacteria bacterium SG8_13]|nr:MAG: exonuclease [Deltaproteobacteria bacterium SG8_13]